MGRKTESRVINGKTYSVTQMNAIDAIKAQGKLAKLLLPIAPALFRQVDDDRDFWGAVIQVLEHEKAERLFEDLASDKFINFFVEMCEQAFIDGEKIDFNDAYTGNLNEAYKCFLFVAEVNFKDFIGGAIGINPMTPVVPQKKKKRK